MDEVSIRSFCNRDQFNNYINTLFFQSDDTVNEIEVDLLSYLKDWKNIKLVICFSPIYTTFMADETYRLQLIKKIYIYVNGMKIFLQIK